MFYGNTIITRIYSMLKSFFTKFKSSFHQDEESPLIGDLSSNPNGLGAMPIMDYSEEPFFILGSVRSGTTMLRNILREHPRLECPEETHFFRWSDSFGSASYNEKYAYSKFFEQHRSMDGIDNFEFHYVRQQALNRKQLMDWYGQKYLTVKNNVTGRWFDKTPQNSYGIMLLSAMYPRAKFIHIHRNPLNVVASLMEGVVMPEHSLKAAINSWLESVMIMYQYQQFEPERVLNVSYEKLTSSPVDCITEVLHFVEEDDSLLDFSKISVHPEKNKYLSKLTQSQVDEIKKHTQHYTDHYGYQL